MSVLVVAEHIRGELRPVTLELISAAKSLGGPVAVAVIAMDPGALTDAVNVEGGTGAWIRAGMPVSNRLSRDQSAGPVRRIRRPARIGPGPTAAHDPPPATPPTVMTFIRRILSRAAFSRR